MMSKLGAPDLVVDQWVGLAVYWLSGRTDQLLLVP
jgi:hypothetical protein